MTTKDRNAFAPSRRAVLAGMGAGLLATTGLVRPVMAQGAPLKLGFQLHSTGIGASYGRWYQRTADAAAKMINDMGGIGGRPIELV